MLNIGSLVYKLHTYVVNNHYQCMMETYVVVDRLEDGYELMHNLSKKRVTVEDKYFAYARTYEGSLQCNDSCGVGCAYFATPKDAVKAHRTVLEDTINYLRLYLKAIDELEDRLSDFYDMSR